MPSQTKLFRPLILTHWLLSQLLIVLLSGNCLGAVAANLQPNVVLILVDDLGWADLGCYAHPWHRTPNIDGLSRDGIRYTNGYSPAPICSAARASILTGKTTARLGFEFVTKNEPGHQKLDSVQPLLTPPFTLNLPLEHHTIGDALCELGYQTAFFGKWHLNQHYQRRYLAWHPKFGPKQQGFEITWESFGGHPYSWRGRPQPPGLPEGRFPADDLFAKAAEFILSKHDAPYLTIISSYYVHTPVQNRCRWLVEQYEQIIPPDIPNRGKRIEYAAFVETLDHYVGQILAAVAKSDSAKDTLVVFLSDNGGHPEFSAAAPLRGSKWNLYEGGIRVPFLAAWPGHIAAGATSDLPVIGYDLLPTFVELAGGAIDGVDGVSLASDWAAGPQRSSDVELGRLKSTDIVSAGRQPRPLVWHFPYYHPESNFSKVSPTIGVNDFAVSQTRPQSAMRLGKYKLLAFAETEQIELYDLEQDVSEQEDLSEEQPELAAKLRRRLDQLLDNMDARRPLKLAQ